LTTLLLNYNFYNNSGTVLKLLQSLLKDSVVCKEAFIHCNGVYVIMKHMEEVTGSSDPVFVSRLCNLLFITAYNTNAGIQLQYSYHKNPLQIITEACLKHVADEVVVLRGLQICNSIAYRLKFKGNILKEANLQAFTKMAKERHHGNAKILMEVSNMTAILSESQVDTVYTTTYL